MFTRGRIDQGGPRGKCSGLSSLYDEVEEFVNIRCRSLLRCAYDLRADAFDFVGNSVWSSLVDRLLEMDSDIFSVGDPDVFHSNFTRSVRFVKRLDEIRNEIWPDTRKSLWQHPRTRDCFERWNCEVYVVCVCVWNSSEFSCALFYHSYITRTLNTRSRTQVLSTSKTGNIKSSRRDGSRQIEPLAPRLNERHNISEILKRGVERDYKVLG